MTNFSYLLDIPAFRSFAPIAESAERILPIDRAACALNCRRAMESAVKWMYAADSMLPEPKSDSLVTLMNDAAFRAIVGSDIWQRMDYVRRMGNQAAHDGTPITREQAVLCLENLFVLLDFIAYCYSGCGEAHEFDRSLLSSGPSVGEVTASAAVDDADLSALLEENRALRAELTAGREQKMASYVRHPLELSEYQTRKLYVDTMLTDAGWIEGQDWEDEAELGRLPDGSGIGVADYLLWGSDEKPLALIEARKTSESVGQGRKRAQLYADVLEKKYGRRPVIFLTNGFETHIIDNDYPERSCSGIWSKKDLERLFSLRAQRGSLKKITVSEKLCGRPCQAAAVKAVIRAFTDQKRRRALVTMAPGAGKTRTAMGLCDVLTKKRYARCVLFLADREELVTQAARAFSELMPNLSYANLCTGEGHSDALYVFSTYRVLYDVIDSADDGPGRLYTVGHFDLVICDDAHRSFFNQYRDIINYFDAPAVAMTATPEKEIDNEIYEFFGLGKHYPTYGYSLAEAVRDGFLADYVTVEPSVRFDGTGAAYDELTEDDRRALEDTYSGGDTPAASRALDLFLSDEDNIRAMLDDVIKRGLRVDNDRTLGKTILFVRDRDHARLVLDVFHRAYPTLVGFAAIADGRDAQTVIDAFADADSPLRLVLSVDMLDTGIDLPCVLNLVFFRRVASKSRFWQMIGRGTRLCPGLIDGQDKDRFFIFDLCGNFEFFRVSRSPDVPANAAGTLFGLRVRLIRALQKKDNQASSLTAIRRALTSDLVRSVQALDRDSFAVRQHLKYIEKYSAPDRWDALTAQDVTDMERELSPLMRIGSDERAELRFDTLISRLMLARLTGKPDETAASALISLLRSAASRAVSADDAALIDALLAPEGIASADVQLLESARRALRDVVREES